MTKALVPTLIKERAKLIAAHDELGRKIEAFTQIIEMMDLDQNSNPNPFNSSKPAKPAKPAKFKKVKKAKRKFNKLSASPWVVDYLTNNGPTHIHQLSQNYRGTFPERHPNNIHSILNSLKRIGRVKNTNGTYELVEY